MINRAVTEEILSGKGLKISVRYDHFFYKLEIKEDEDSLSLTLRKTVHPNLEPSPEELQEIETRKKKREERIARIKAKRSQQPVISGN
ncbi:MAG: hypothetical protein ACW98Y_09510 [Candidatus Thorarchaeota archaeon]|jgi:hypothetical protein